MSKLLCVYCASSTKLDPKYYAAAGQIGHAMAAEGWDLIYGGGNAGLMGSVARAVKGDGGRVVGIIPDFMIERELAYREADELVVVKTMRERKRIMAGRADAFLALPGGIGTLEELSEVLTERYLNLSQKPVVIFNQDGFYDDLLRFFERMVRENFKRPGMSTLYSVANSADEIWPLIANAPAFEAESLWTNDKKS
ncbi:MULTISPECIES: TIGR00730 family Rossman fold protein [unclassified Ereboglobus]|uniref:LOG family protein n=1 Tax=unclassified Ereboglobus TaxID=2626932 RepID=UPI00240603E0|nr:MULTISPECIES: TIGR00730 family Rossman fold protein [unclassified Ereboglobus]